MHDVRAITRAGRLVVQKDATDGVGRARLAHEQDILRRLAGPGIPEVMAWDPDAASLVVDHRGTALTGRTHAVEQTVTIVADVADIVGRLHAEGWSHAALAADHVLLDTEGTVSLCGLGAATRLDDASRAEDIAALGRLLTNLLDSAPSPMRSGLRSRLPRSPNDLAVRAPEVAARAIDCRSLAERLRDLVPDVGVPEAAPRRPLLGSPRVVIAFVVAIGAGAAALLVAPTGARPPTPGASPTTVVPSESTTSRPATTTSAPPPTPRPVSIGVDGRVATVDGRRIEVGSAGDVVVVGDWDCDGLATAAVLRPASGSVFVFDHWPESGIVTEAPLVTIEGLVDLVVSDAECPTLLGIDRAGTSRELT